MNRPFSNQSPNLAVFALLAAAPPIMTSCQSVDLSKKRVDEEKIFVVTNASKIRLQGNGDSISAEFDGYFENKATGANERSRQSISFEYGDLLERTDRQVISHLAYRYGIVPANDKAAERLTGIIQTLRDKAIKKHSTYAGPLDPKTMTGIRSIPPTGFVSFAITASEPTEVKSAADTRKAPSENPEDYQMELKLHGYNVINPGGSTVDRKTLHLVPDSVTVLLNAQMILGHSNKEIYDAVDAAVHTQWHTQQTTWRDDYKGNIPAKDFNELLNDFREWAKKAPGLKGIANGFDEPQERGRYGEDRPGERLRKQPSPQP